MLPVFELLLLFDTRAPGGALQPRDPETFPFVVLANKIDMVQERAVDLEAVKGWCIANGDIPYFEVCLLLLPPQLLSVMAVVW